MEYVIQRENKKRSDTQKDFYDNSILTLEKHRLSLAVLRETIVEIVVSSKKNNLQDRRQSCNVVNKISSEIIYYNCADAKLTRESLQHQAKEATLMRK